MLLWQNGNGWANFGEPLDEWIDETASALATAALSTVAVLDCEAVIIDGAMPAAVRQRLVAAVRTKLGDLDRQGVVALYDHRRHHRRRCQGDGRGQRAAAVEFRDRPRRAVQGGCGLMPARLTRGEQPS